VEVEVEVEVEVKVEVKVEVEVEVEVEEAVAHNNQGSSDETRKGEKEARPRQLQEGRPSYTRAIREATKGYKG